MRLFLLASMAAAMVADGPDPAMLVDPRSASSVERGGWLVHDFTVSDESACVFSGLYEVDLAIHFRASRRRPDRRVVISRDRFDGKVWRGDVLDARGRRRGAVRGRTTGCRRFEWRVRRSALPRELRRYHWSLTVMSACRPREDIEYALCGGPKLDRLPDGGTVTQRLRRR